MLFTLALTLTLVALKTSQVAMRRQIDIIDEVASKGGALDAHRNRANSFTAGLNYLALFAFIAGIVLTVIYAAVNAA